MDGLWIGIDYGTSHCGVAIWDSRRGSPKWMRMGPLAIPESRKEGRLVPSAILFLSKPREHSIPYGNFHVLVGHAALQEDTSSSEALLIHPKRLFTTKETTASIRPLGSTETVEISARDAATVILKALRQQADAYLRQRKTQRKQMQHPGKGLCRHVVLGVPVSFEHATSLEQAAINAGFTSAQTIPESTAAALAYGLGVNSGEPKNILIVDMGGGTTDITLARLQQQKLRVLKTKGDSNLGGYNMDEAIMNLVLRKSGAGTVCNALLRLCRGAKEELSTQDSTKVTWQDQTIPLTRNEFEHSIQDILQACQELIPKDPSIDEVILIGGATRVPAVRSRIQTLFPSKELCLSLDPMSAVALGTAIQAALVSQQVPRHEIRSALMLDVVPHDLGILSGTRFVQLIAAGTSLPATGSASFCLADPKQAGVTIEAVEQVDAQVQVPMESFSFLLHRVSVAERWIDVGMKLDEHGALTVSIWDPHDPEHQAKRRLVDDQTVVAARPLLESAVEENEDPWTLEQIMLVSGCLGLFLSYVIVKMAFHDVQPGSEVL